MSSNRIFLVTVWLDYYKIKVMRPGNSILVGASKTQNEGKKPNPVLQHNTRCLPPPFMIDIDIFFPAISSHFLLKKIQVNR